MKRTIKQTMQHLPLWWLILPRGDVACRLLPTSETPKNENQEGNPRGFSRREFRVAGMKCACTKIVSATIMTTEEVVSGILRSESRKASRTERYFLPDSWVLWVHLEWLSCLWISGRWGSDHGTAHSRRVRVSSNSGESRVHTGCRHSSSDSPWTLRAVNSLRNGFVRQVWEGGSWSALTFWPWSWTFTV